MQIREKEVRGICRDKRLSIAIEKSDDESFLVKIEVKQFCKEHSKNSIPKVITNSDIN